jgi:osmotically-inducible protein OsmY
MQLGSMDRKRNARRIGLGVTVWLLVGMLAAAAGGAVIEIDDPAIRNAVENELLKDFVVPLNDIDVASSDGVVTLTGNVDDLLTKERATEIARTVRGVRSVVNRIQVEPPVLRTDAEIENDVEEALYNDPATESYEIDVDAANNRVTLSGTVDSWQERRLAEKVAKGVRGVVNVINNITVRPPEKRSDVAIRADVEQVLKWDALVDHRSIDVSVQDREVRLAGTVGSAAEKNQAVMDAWVTGVTAVDDSELEVRTWARTGETREDKWVVKSDENIRQAVKDALFYDPRVNLFEIEVAVDAGFVTLRGTVDNLKAKRAAEADAANTVGVMGVTNRIKIRTEEIEEQALAESVRSALQRDPLVDRYEIDVNVIDRTVYLNGTVDNYYEKSRADELAANVKGVVSVENNLEVADTTEPYLSDPYTDDWIFYDGERYDYQPPLTFKSDGEIKSEIESELFWSPFVDEDRITVEVENGIATLSGTVDSKAERSTAEANAFDGGAVLVNNDLEIE